MKLMYRCIIMLLLLGLVLSSTALAQDPGQVAPKPDETDVRALQNVVTSLSNSFVRVDAGDTGMFVIGTTGGDPAIASDDNKRLMYGFEPGGASDIWSSFTTVRIGTGGVYDDYELDYTIPSQGPTNTGSAIVTAWTLADGIQVQQTLSLVTNPYSGRDDVAKIAYVVTNQAGAAREVGIRCMLDVMVGDNDRAPYFVPGVGNSNLEQEFTSADMPAYYYAFESLTYEADSLKGQGLLSGPGLTEPDLFQIAAWSAVVGTVWEYTVDPAMETDDSATVMYWNPRNLNPGQSFSVATAYGLAGSGGGSTWISAPVRVPTSATSFQVTAWVNNATDTSFTGGTSTITLPAGLQLQAGETATKNIGDVDPGMVQQVSWQVDITGGEGTYDYSVTTTFASGSDPLAAEAQIVVWDIVSSVFMSRIMKN